MPGQILKSDMFGLVDECIANVRTSAGLDIERVLPHAPKLPPKFPPKPSRARAGLAPDSRIAILTRADLAPIPRANAPTAKSSPAAKNSWANTAPKSSPAPAAGRFRAAKNLAESVQSAAPVADDETSRPARRMTRWPVVFCGLVAMAATGAAFVMSPLPEAAEARVYATEAKAYARLYAAEARVELARALDSP